MRNSAWLLVAVIVMMRTSVRAAADIGPNGAMESTVVHVVDEGGKPLSGATVKVTGLRSREEPGSWYGWGSWYGVESGTGGADKVVTTDAEGKASVSFPGHPMDNLTTGTVIVRVRHPDMCATEKELNLEGPGTVKLERGTEVTWTAQPVPGIRRVYVDFEESGERGSALAVWRHSADGLTASARLPNGNYFCRVVALTEKGKAYFGEPGGFSLPSSADDTAGKAPGDGWRIEKAVREGRSITGTLDPAVPRPVKGGWVVADVASTQQGAEGEHDPAAVIWYRSADVAADGSFTLANLPAGSVEVLAGCDGWVSKNGDATPGVRMRKARAFDDPSDRTIPMEQTGTARITVEGPDGKPLAGADVGFWPNQSMRTGTSIIGMRVDSEDILRLQDRGLESMASYKPRTPNLFEAKTDANGVAIIRAVPAGEEMFQVTSEAFEMPILEAKFGPCREGSVMITGGNEVAATVKMEPKGSSSLSAAVQAYRMIKQLGL